MKKDIPRKKINLQSRNKQAAEGEKSSPGGLHYGDYRPRYQETFDIYEKAKNHARDQKKKYGKYSDLVQAHEKTK